MMRPAQCTHQPFSPLPDTHPLMRGPAWWHPTAPREDVTVLWRCRFTVSEPVAAGQHCWISASQRVRLWLSGEGDSAQPILLADGPSRSDPWRWHTICIELPALGAGDWLLGAEVWHAGEGSGIGQMGPAAYFAFAMQNAELDAVMGGGAAWRCRHDPARRMRRGHHWPKGSPYYPLGWGEDFDAASHAWGWRGLHHDDASWCRARRLTAQIADRWGNLPVGARLHPDPLPAMMRQTVSWQRVAGAEGLDAAAAAAWLAGKSPLRIERNSRAQLILDRGGMTNAIPTLSWSGGAGAALRLVWSEGGFDPQTRRKGRRDELEGRELWGFLDRVSPDGGDDRTWTPPWFRSFRYLDLTVTTGDEPLTLGPCELTATGYPFRVAGRIGGLTDAQDQVWRAAWNTVQLCSHETFFDCPQYEQAQFAGDSPVTARVACWLTGDDRLVRKCLDDLHASQLPGGMLQCRYPSRQVQILPTYALHWVQFLEDLLRHRGAVDFLRPYLPGARAVLQHFERGLRADGLPGRIAHAPFVDWARGFDAGNAPQDADGGSAIVGAMLARTARALARLEEHAGIDRLAPLWHEMADRLADGVHRCWDARRAMLADRPGGGSYSVHAQVEALLADILTGEQARRALTGALEADDAVQVGTFHYAYYLIRALRAVGDRDRIRSLWPRWNEVLNRTALTTFPESYHEPRSDCHAWSSGIVLSLIEDLLGVRVAADAIASDPIEFAPDPQAQPLDACLCTPAGKLRIVLGPIQPDGTRMVGFDTPVSIRLEDGQALGPGRHEVRYPADTPTGHGCLPESR